MDLPGSNEVTTFESGVKMEERRFQWRIQNFHVVLLHDSLIDTQLMEFSAGESIGLDSKWRVVLSSVEMDGKKWAGIYLVLRERATLSSKFLFVHCSFMVKDGDGEIIIRDDIRFKDMYNLGGMGWGIPQFIERDGDTVELMEENDALVVHITFKIYFPAISVVTPSLEATLAKFRKDSGSKALADLADVNVEAGTRIKIMSSDKNIFRMKKEVISARSPVFEAMLKSNMTEGKNGTIRIPDMRSRSLRVLLNYICGGVLKKAWRDSEVLVELTNAAAKYQLPELLNFLDQVAGKVCDADNAGALMILANRLPLKQAEKDLLSFVRINGAGSLESFIKILTSVSCTSETEKTFRDVVGTIKTGGGKERDIGPSTTGSNTPTGKRAAGEGEEINRNGNSDKEVPAGKKCKHV